MVFKKGDTPWNKGTKKITSKEETNARNRASYYKFRDRRINSRKELVRKVRYDTIFHYSNGRMTCECCDESEYEFLTIDHINNKSEYNHTKLEGGGNALISWIRRNNFPEGFRVLCMNCNYARGKNYMNGICPHTLQRKDDWELEL